MGEVRPPAQNTGVGGWFGGARGYADHLVSLKRPLGEVRAPHKTPQGEEDGAAVQGVVQIIWYLFRDPWAR